MNNHHQILQRRDLWRLCFILVVLLASCGDGSKKASTTSTAIDYNAVSIPQFNADSAYRYVADQLAYGCRTPNSEAQKKCAHYLVGQLQKWCDTVIVQEFPAQLWDGTTVRGKNIIASIEAPAGTPNRRIILGAHWDSRLWADHDPDQSNHRKPILGANDGASGVGLLLELARVVSAKRPNTSIDIILFDVEDQGVPEWADTYQDDSWCIGSQYWAAHPHTPHYTALYGVLLDMVGTQQPRYTKENVSRHFAGSILNKYWDVAAALGYGNIFVNQDTPDILDDHYYVNRLAGIPMIDIVQNSPDCSFFPYWHTLGDNLDHVDKNTLAITAKVILKTIYGDYGE